MKKHTSSKPQDPFKVFAKDCKRHFSKSVLQNTHVSQENYPEFILKEKSTRNSRNVQKY